MYNIYKNICIYLYSSIIVISSANNKYSYEYTIQILYLKRYVHVSLTGTQNQTKLTCLSKCVTTASMEFAEEITVVDNDLHSIGIVYNRSSCYVVAYSSPHLLVLYIPPVVFSQIRKAVSKNTFTCTIISSKERLISKKRLQLSYLLIILNTVKTFFFHLEVIRTLKLLNSLKCERTFRKSYILVCNIVTRITL